MFEWVVFFDRPLSAGLLTDWPNLLSEWRGSLVRLLLHLGGARPQFRESILQLTICHDCSVCVFEFKAHHNARAVRQ